MEVDRAHGNTVSVVEYGMYIVTHLKTVRRRYRLFNPLVTLRTDKRRGRNTHQEKHTLLKAFTAVLLQTSLSNKSSAFLHQIVEAGDVSLHFAQLHQILLQRGKNKLEKPELYNNFVLESFKVTY